MGLTLALYVPRISDKPYCRDIRKRPPIFGSPLDVSLKLFLSLLLIVTIKIIAIIIRIITFSIIINCRKALR